MAVIHDTHNTFQPWQLPSDEAFLLGERFITPPGSYTPTKVLLVSAGAKKCWIELKDLVPPPGTTWRTIESSGLGATWTSIEEHGVRTHRLTSYADFADRSLKGSQSSSNEVVVTPLCHPTATWTVVSVVDGGDAGDGHCLSIRTGSPGHEGLAACVVDYQVQLSALTLRPGASWQNLLSTITGCQIRYVRTCHFTWQLLDKSGKVLENLYDTRATWHVQGHPNGRSLKNLNYLTAVNPTCKTTAKIDLKHLLPMPGRTWCEILQNPALTRGVLSYAGQEVWKLCFSDNLNPTYLCYWKKTWTINEIRRKNTGVYLLLGKIDGKSLAVASSKSLTPNPGIAWEKVIRVSQTTAYEYVALRSTTVPGVWKLGMGRGPSKITWNTRLYSASYTWKVLSTFNGSTTGRKAGPGLIIGLEGQSQQESTAEIFLSDVVPTSTTWEHLKRSGNALVGGQFRAIRPLVWSFVFATSDTKSAILTVCTTDGDA